MTQVRECDVAIIGAGVAGLSAATAAAQAGRAVLVIERMGAGGQVMTVDHVANFAPWPQGIAGYDLGPQLQEQAEAAGAEFMLDDVVGLQPAASPGARHQVLCEGTRIAARAVIVAAGSLRRKLQVDGEEALDGRGVSHCASCDGPLYRGQDVCVVGGGDSAVGEAAVLAPHARQVFMVFPGDALHAQPYLREALAAHANVQLMPHHRVTAITGDDSGVNGVTLQDSGGASHTLAVHGVFTYAGLQPATRPWGTALAVDADGRLLAGESLQTGVAGIYAAGDIRAGNDCTLNQAAQDGTRAAQSAIAYLNEGDTR